MELNIVDCASDNPIGRMRKKVLKPQAGCGDQRGAAFCNTAAAARVTHARQLESCATIRLQMSSESAPSEITL